MPASAAELPLDHTNKLFGIVYITLTGVIDTIVPAAGPWSWVGKSMSYLIKLAPILWWALPTQSATCQFPNTSEPANQVSPKMMAYLGLFAPVLEKISLGGGQGCRQLHGSDLAHPLHANAFRFFL
ncbi:hypothetical protein DSO57_1017205 [Entomophthora muscae]|uniref:Uncharacterized protein n=1 Tax=Entomophthora muscae TaxID=34485 RepID=A0ACC2T4J5_9FUNG|nr:hypothetical protein DSO57_1017205 [Entomophthora muscae]